MKKNEHIEQLISRVLSGNATEQEFREVENWKNESQDNVLMYQQLQDTWELTLKRNQASIPLIDVDAEWAKFRQNAEIREKPQRNYLLRVAAVLVIGLVAATIYFFIPRDQVFESNTYGTVVELVDGSKVTLSKDAVLRVDKDFGTDNRALSLSGEAYFEVVSDSSTFRVSLGTSAVEVVGTAFNIRNAEGAPTEVVVTEGIVTFKNTSTELRLIKGEKGILQGGQIEKSTNTDVNFNAWLTRTITLEGQTLPEVVALLNRVYDRSVILETYEECTVNATFESQSLESVMRVLTATLDLTVEERGEQIVITNAVCR